MNQKFNQNYNSILPKVDVFSQTGNFVGSTKLANANLYYHKLTYQTKEKNIKLIFTFSITPFQRKNRKSLNVHQDLL